MECSILVRVITFHWSSGHALTWMGVAFCGIAAKGSWTEVCVKHSVREAGIQESYLWCGWQSFCSVTHKQSVDFIVVESVWATVLKVDGESLKSRSKFAFCQRVHSASDGRSWCIWRREVEPLKRDDILHSLLWPRICRPHLWYLIWWRLEGIACSNLDGESAQVKTDSIEG